MVCDELAELAAVSGAGGAISAGRQPRLCRIWRGLHDGANEVCDWPPVKRLGARSSRLQLSLAAATATAILAFGASGQIASAEAADEPAGPPSPYARTAFAYGIVKTEAVLIGYVNARGSSTTAQFQVGRTKSYGRWFPPGQPEQFYSGHHSSEVEQGVYGLRPGTTYHFRLVATNEGGKTYGKDKTFRTLPR